MALTERLALVIQGDASSAVRAFNMTGDAARKATASASAGQAGVKTAFAEFAKSPLAMAAAAATAAKALLSTARAASNLNEQVSAAKVQFGGAADSVLSFAKGAIDGFGLSNRAALEASNSFAALFQNAGLNEQATASFSVALTKLGADLSSFKNIAQGDVLGALRSGLTGEVEPLRRLGIIINDATVQAKAMQLGLASANGTVDDGAKVVARYALILEQTKKAQGDYSRTSDGMANAQRTLNAALENLQATLGQGVAPAVAEVAGAFSDLAQAADGLLSPIGGLGTVSRVLANVWLTTLPVLGPLVSLTSKHKDASKEAAQAQKDYAAALSQAESVQRSFQQATKDAAKDEKNLTSAIVSLVHAREGQEDAQQTVSRALRAEKDAQADLNRLQQQGAVDAKAVARANDSLRDASRSVADALDAQSDAQRALDRARNPASKLDLREAELDLSAARRNQQKATLGVAKSQDELNRLVVIGVLKEGQAAATLLDVEDASLGVADAKEQIERADIALQRSQEQLTRLQDVGKDSTDEVKDAQKRLADATDAVAKAQDGERKAREELADATAGDPEFKEKLRDAQQKVADAHDNTAKAIRNARDATLEAAGAQDTYNDALATGAAVTGQVLKNFEGIAGVDLSKFKALVPQGGAPAVGVGALAGLSNAFLGQFANSAPTASGMTVTINQNFAGNPQPWQMALAAQETANELAKIGKRNGG